MSDLIFIGISLAFFAASLLLVSGCQRLREIGL